MKPHPVLNLVLRSQPFLVPKLRSKPPCGFVLARMTCKLPDTRRPIVVERRQKNTERVKNAGSVTIGKFIREQQHLGEVRPLILRWRCAKKALREASFLLLRLADEDAPVERADPRAHLDDLGDVRLAIDRLGLGADERTVEKEKRL